MKQHDANLTQYEIELTILNGEVTAEDRIKYKLVHEAIGGLWLVDDKDVAAFVYGWFFINTTSTTTSGSKFAKAVMPAAVFLSTSGRWRMTRGGAAARSRSSAHQSALIASRRLTMLVSHPREKVGLGASTRQAGAY